MNSRLVAIPIGLGGAGYLTERIGVIDLPGLPMDYLAGGVLVTVILACIQRLRGEAPQNG